MKRCAYCSKEYPDDATYCAIDQQPLQAVYPVPPAADQAPRWAPGTRKRLVNIAPIRAGLVSGILYGALSLIAVPFLLLAFALSPTASSRTNLPTIMFAVMAVAVPIVYAVLGFIIGLIAAALYNLIAHLTGGLEFEVRDAPAAH